MCAGLADATALGGGNLDGAREILPAWIQARPHVVAELRDVGRPDSHRIRMCHGDGLDDVGGPGRGRLSGDSSGPGSASAG
jgi:hypothetical protein